MTLLGGASLTLIALVVAARRSQSSLPLYAAMGLATAMGLWIKNYLGIQTRTGLVQALVASGAIGLAFYLDRRKTWQEAAPRDTLLEGNFPLRRARFLPTSLEVGALVATLASASRAFAAFAPMVEAPRVSLALAVDAALLGYLAGRFSSTALAYAFFVPLAGALSAAVISLPVAFRPHGTLLVVAALLWFRQWLGQRKPDGGAVTNAWVRVSQALVVASVPASFLGYLVWWEISLELPLGLLAGSFGYPVRQDLGPPGSALTYALLALGFCQRFVVQPENRYHQVVLLHWAAFWSLALASTVGAHPASVVGLAAALFLPGYLWEQSERPMLAAYARNAQPWLLACGLAYAALGWGAFPEMSLLPYWVLGWVLLQVGNRNWGWLAVVMVKAWVSVQIARLLVGDFLTTRLLAGEFLTSLLLGAAIFYVLERSVEEADQRFELRLSRTPFAAAPRWALVLHLFVPFVLLSHLVFFARALSGGGSPPPHGVLYGLVGLTLLVYYHLRYAYLPYLAAGVFVFANILEVMRFRLAVDPYQISLLHLMSVASLGSIGVFRPLAAYGARGARALKALAQPLDRVSFLLGFLVIALLSANFLVAHQLSEATRLRFLLSGALLLGTALYFRHGIAPVEAAHRAAYRIATTMAFWSFGYAIFPYPETFLYLIVVPAFFFLLRAESKVRRNRETGPDVVAAGILFALAVLLYVEQQPLQVLLFPQSPFAWGDYYDRAWALLLCALGLARLARWSEWKSLSLVGCLLVMGSLVLIASKLASPPVFAGEGWPSVFPLPFELAFLVLVVHAAFALLLRDNPMASFWFRFSGLDPPEQASFRSFLYGIGMAALLASLPAILILARGAPATLPLALATIAGGLYYRRPQSIAYVLAGTAILMFPVGALFYPDLNPVSFSVMLALTVVTITALRRARGFESAAPDWVFLLSGGLGLASLATGDILSPRSLFFFGVVFSSWAALPRRPLDLPAEKHYWLWPPLAAVVLLCLQRGFTPGLLPLWANLTLLPPILGLALAAWWKKSQPSGFPHALEPWLAAAQPALSTLSQVSGIIAIASVTFNYSRLEAGWTELALILSALVAGGAIQLYQTLGRASATAAIRTELFIWTTLIVLRLKAAAVQVVELGSPLDAYLLLAAAAVASGVRELVRRRLPHLEGHLYRSSLVYGLLGWCYALWLRWETGTLWHAELGSLALSGLFFWFALRRARANLIPAFVFVNLTSILIFYRLAWYNPQFYVLPAAGSALALAQAFRDNLTPSQLKAIRLWCGLLATGIPSFYDVVAFDASVWYPVSAALVSALSVVVGISLRVRIYLYLGTCSFLFNTLAVLVHVIKNQPPEHVKLLIGLVFLVTGLLFTGSFLLFQMKRQQILNEYRRLLRELESWE